MEKTLTSQTHDVPHPFIQRHQADVMGVLHGWDRLRLSGRLRALYDPPVMQEYLNKARVGLKDFKGVGLQRSGQIKAATQGIAQKVGRPMIDLSSRAVRKEERALSIAPKAGVHQGLIAVLRCVEPCRPSTGGGHRQTQPRELPWDWGQGLHSYFYHPHPEFGRMHLRRQRWFPFLMNSCLKGGQWRARPMAQAGLKFEQRDHCLTWMEDVEQAPRLAELYPSWVHHGIKSFGSGEVLRFLGDKPPPNGVGKFLGPVTRSLKKRPEGLRLKPFVKGHSLKLYDKPGRGLRVETTLNHPDEFKVYRARENRPQDKKQGCELRRSLADLQRRAQVSQAAHDRY